MKIYVAKRGDYVAQVAALSGLAEAAMWGHPHNSRIAAARHAEVLLPGDILHVPARAKPRRFVLPYEDNQFEARVAHIEVHVRFVGAAGTFSNEPYEIEGLPYDVSGRIAQDGLLSVRVPMIVRNFIVRFSGMNRSVRVEIGALDPADTDTGVEQRLANLGYFSNLEGKVGKERAIRQFQADRGLEVTGIDDEMTRRALEHAHER